MENISCNKGAIFPYGLQMKKELLSRVRVLLAASLMFLLGAVRLSLTGAQGQNRTVLWIGWFAFRLLAGICRRPRLSIHVGRASGTRHPANRHSLSRRRCRPCATPRGYHSKVSRSLHLQCKFGRLDFPPLVLYTPFVAKPSGVTTKRGTRLSSSNG